MSVLDDLVTVEELAKRLGSRKLALRLLRSLNVPLAAGEVFSARLLRERVETPHPALDSDRPPAIALLSRTLTGHGIHVSDWRIGRPTTLRLRATHERVKFGYDDPVLGGPVVIGTAEDTVARVYSTSRRTKAGKASFSISGFNDPEGAPLYLFALLDEGITWGMTKGEVAWVAEQLSSGIRGELARNFVAHTRPGALRAAFPKAPNDWLLDGRMEPLRDGSS